MAELRSVDIDKINGATGMHSYSHEEAEAFSSFINNNLSGDPELKDVLPLDPSDGSLFRACKDGILLAKLINDAVAGTIDERALNHPSAGRALNAWQVGENQNIVIGSARAIGCRVINVGPEDLAAGTPHLVLGLVWQVVRIGCLATITLKDHPELYRLLEEGEKLEDFVRLPPEEILIRWFNYHLKAANWPRRVTNFTSDIQDAENYTVLLAQIAPDKCTRAPLQSETEDRAKQVISSAARLGVDPFLQPRDIMSGNHKLNLTFVAELFNAHPALQPLDDNERELIDGADWDDPTLGREERAFRNWINNLGLTDSEGAPYFVDHLFEDLRDGIGLLRIIDKIEPGIVDWKKVTTKRLNSFSKVQNCNYALELSKQLKAKIIGIDGKNISDAQPRGYTLAVIWQLQRYNLLNTLTHLAAATGQGEITEEDVVQWANTTATRGNSEVTIRDFKDKKLVDSRFILCCVNGIEPRAVDWSNYVEGANIENARYALTAMRRIGASPFAIAEDICEGKSPKLMLQLFASLY